jgi:hypothetical protein
LPLILLIKNRYYTPTAQNLPSELFALVEDFTHNLTFEEAEKIFFAKNYETPPMRGRTSFDPLEKLGLVMLDKNKRVKITDFGRMFLDGEIDLGEMVFSSLLKTQFPYPLANGRNDYNIKPFIGTLHLIKEVNRLWGNKGENPVGISREEFGIFALSLKSYLQINATAEKLIAFRTKKRSLKTEKERTDFVSDFILKYLADFKNPVKNINEYTDNMMRYLRLTKYVYIRGNGYYIDLEPRRMIEINAILQQDNGSAKEFTLEEYQQYISDYNAYTLPFETVKELTDIAKNICQENTELCDKLNIPVEKISISDNSEDLKKLISALREERTRLQNLVLKQEYQETEKIDNAISALNSVLDKKTKLANKPSVELEKWTNVALNILNDAELIKPNAPLGDDNEPTFTAPANVPDIECYYDGFGAICEVTMLTGRNQWYNEGQPVMRHLRDFETEHNNSYCLFIAPSLHQDTINTFWNAVKYEYQGEKQKIIPITISSLSEILQIVKAMKINHRKFTKNNLRSLYDNCVDIANVGNSTEWVQYIKTTIHNWGRELIA